METAGILQPPEQLIETLTGTVLPVIAGHVTPDADCLGSMLALSLGIQQHTGNLPLCALHDRSVSRRLQFITEWVPPAIASHEQCWQAKVMAVCDTAKAQRADLPGDLSNELGEGRTVVNIDHHTSNPGFGAINYVDAQASSTAELIYRLFRAADWEISPTIASLLYCGMHADTIGFSLASTSAAALRAAADLVQHGADVAAIGHFMWRSLSENEFNLRRIVYGNARVSTTGRIAFSTASHNEIVRSGCKAEDIDDQVEIPRSVDGMVLAMLFTEANPHKVRINFRSKGEIGVLELAQQLQGGGHYAAAGTILDGTIEDAVARVIPMAEQYLDRFERQAAER